MAYGSFTHHHHQSHQHSHHLTATTCPLKMGESSTTTKIIQKQEEFNKIYKEGGEDHNGEERKDDDGEAAQQNITEISVNDLTVLSGATLLAADCIGTGILALPHDMEVLGLAFGLTFLLLNLALNLYAGKILGETATVVEKRLCPDGIGNEEVNELLLSEATSSMVAVCNSGKRKINREGESSDDIETIDYDYAEDGDDGNVIEKENNATTPNQHNYRFDRNATLTMGEILDDDCDSSSNSSHDDDKIIHSGITQTTSSLSQGGDHTQGNINNATSTTATHHTFDFISITSHLFDNPMSSNDSVSHELRATTSKSNSSMTRFVMIIYYTNIFLVLGNYILVMSHAVSAMFGDTVCLPIAGVIASVLMVGVSQLRTMSSLGRGVSVASLVTLAIVIVQCLHAIHTTRSTRTDDVNTRTLTKTTGSTWLDLAERLASMSSIGFAVGSQKLFLNIRHEFGRRENAVRSLALALTTFGIVYILICLLAGPDPPPLLFDAIRPGVNRRIAGLLLWIHVSVSYAINSQALCSSIDRMQLNRLTRVGLKSRHKLSWALITLLVACSSYLVANMVPFFKDLVSLIGALTSVPLTLFLPAILYRKILQVPLFKLRSRHDIYSYLLIVFSIAFLVAGFFGSIGSISIDWANHGSPFACR